MVSELTARCLGDLLVSVVQPQGCSEIARQSRPQYSVSAVAKGAFEVSSILAEVV